jgi:hypothetical protein
MPNKREYDPLSVIPSATIVRQRLERTEAQARKLRILLQTAEQLERADQDEPAESGKGGHNED